MASNCYEAPELSNLYELSFLPGEFLPVLALSLLYETLVQLRPFHIFLVFAWMLFLQLCVYAQPQRRVDSKRMAVLSEIKEVNLGDVVPNPSITLEPVYTNPDAIPIDLKNNAEHKIIKKYIEEVKKGAPDKVYVEISDYLKHNPNSAFLEWLNFYKADLLLQVQIQKETPKFNFALEDYESAVRLFPTSDEIPRALYQAALIRLKMNLYSEVEDTVDRALENFPGNKFEPKLYLLRGEQAFLAKHFKKALGDFSLVVRNYPRSQASVDSAFRRAFILFQEGEYEKALETYQNLDKFHSETMEKLKMTKEPSSEKRYLDRVYYAETLYVTKNYDKASDMFQILANLFPNNSEAPLLWIRYADTFFARSEPQAAYRIYEYILSQSNISDVVKIISSLRVADTLFLTDDIRAQERNQGLYQSAYKLALKDKDDILASLSLAKLSLFNYFNQSYPKAMKLLKEYRIRFPKTRNIGWASDHYVKLLEIEIMDYYHYHDYLAALTAYLVNEKDASVKFDNVAVLIHLADVARDLSLLNKAKQILNRVIYIESSSDARQEALLKLIQILIQQGELKQASERLRRFDFAYPRTKLSYLYEKAWGDLYLSLDNARRAVEHYEKALKFSKGNPKAILKIRQVYMSLGGLYGKIELPVKAIDSYQKYINLYSNKEKIKLKEIPYTPRDEHFLNVSRYRISDLYYDMKDYVHALRAYKKVSEEVKVEPFYSHAGYRIGECYLALDDRDAALEAFGKVKSKDPKNLWMRAAQSYIKSVQMEVKDEIRIFN